jgi:hypothetical protein
MIRTLLCVLVLASSCGGGDNTEIKRDPERQRRVIEPPSGRVRALPPYAIRADGVGPYRLGETLLETLAELPKGPRAARFELPGVHRSVLHAEDDQILIGGEPLGKATFVAVVGAAVARTESGVHVGSSRDDITRALGAPIVQLERARDPRVAVPANARTLRVIYDGDRAIALVVVADAEPSAAAGSGDTACARPTADKRIGACLATGELVEVDGEDVIVHHPDAEKPVTTARVPNLVFVAPLRIPGEDRDELVAIARVDDAQARTWSLVALRLDAGKLVRTIDSAPVYQLTAANARWLGVDLRDVDLYLELTGHPEAIDVGGLVVTRAGGNDPTAPRSVRDAVSIAQLAAIRRAR